MQSLQSPRGTRDILPEQQVYWRKVREKAEKVAQLMGFQAISTPTYEYRSLFERSIGEGTDVMDKELFVVRGSQAGAEEEYALRPEGTAGIVRAFIEHGMHLRPHPIKLYSFVNCFRYDRPQKGRYREHVQFDLELFGEPGPFSDAWIILASYYFTQFVGLKDVKIQLNSLGTLEERKNYETALVAALQSKAHLLTEDSRARLAKNPLRILDSKDASDQALLNDLPKLADFFGEASAAHFEAVQQYLRDWRIPHILNPRLVRGLDYYCHTAFEITTETAGGQQSSLGGGGRYDGLITQLGGTNIGGVGAGIGLDRVIEEMERQGVNIPVAKPKMVAVIAADAIGKPVASRLIAELLSLEVGACAAIDKEGLSAQLKAAAKVAQTAVIIGQQEVANNTYLVKNLENGEQQVVPQSEIGEFFRP